MSSIQTPGNVNSPGQAASATTPVLRLRLIGQMEAWTLNSETVLPSGKKTRALLAVIALSGSRPALRGRLAELLWSRRPEEQARASLRQEIHRLLDLLSPAGEDILVVTRDHLMLRPGAAWVDVDEVMRASLAAPASLSLLDGDLLEDLDGVDASFDNWLAAERERLRDHGRNLAEQLLREQVEPEGAIPAAQRLLLIDRTHEGAWRAVMRGHAARGERGQAIQAYERCRAVLADLLDAAPSEETQKLLAEIRGPGGKGTRRLPVSQEAPALEREAEPAIPVQDLWIHAPTSAIDTRELRPVRGGARVGILPFQMVGTSSDDAHLGPGLADEMTTALSRFRWLMVVLIGSLDSLPADRRDESSIRRAFGLDFLLNGSVQRVAERLRVTIRLIDLRDGNHVVWARRFDRVTSDLLNLQDEIAAEVVAQVDPEILLIEAKRVAARPLMDSNAYDLVLRAVPLIWRMEHGSYLQAGEYLAKSIELDPEFASARAWYAIWYNFYVGQGWAPDPVAAMEQASLQAERAVSLDPQDARGLTIAGHIRAFLSRLPQEGLSLHARALELNPNLAMAWAFSAFSYVYLGDLNEAEIRANRYKRLSPADSTAFVFDSVFVQIHLHKRDYESAIFVGRQLTLLNPYYSNLLKPYLSALGHAGVTGEAKAVRDRLFTVEPEFTIRRFNQTSPLIHDQDRAHVAHGLALAGLPYDISPPALV